MTRGIDATTLAAIEASTATPIYFVELGPFDSVSPEVTERMHNGLGTITWGSNDWLGVGSLGSIEMIKQSSDGTRPEPMRMTLSGVNSDVLDIALDTKVYHNRNAKVYIGALSGGALVATPSVIFSGFIQSVEIVMGGGENGDTVVLTAESEQIRFDRTNDVRFTDPQLQSEYSGDLGLQFLEDVMTRKVVWRGGAVGMGGQASRGNTGGSGSGSREQPFDPR